MTPLDCSHTKLVKGDLFLGRNLMSELTEALDKSAQAKSLLWEFFETVKSCQQILENKNRIQKQTMENLGVDLMESHG